MSNKGVYEVILLILHAGSCWNTFSWWLLNPLLLYAMGFDTYLQVLEYNMSRCLCVVSLYVLQLLLTSHLSCQTIAIDIGSLLWLFRLMINIRIYNKKCPFIVGISHKYSCISLIERFIKDLFKIKLIFGKINLFCIRSRPSLSELTPIIFNMELTHSEVSIYQGMVQVNEFTITRWLSKVNKLQTYDFSTSESLWHP